LAALLLVSLTDSTLTSHNVWAEMQNVNRADILRLGMLR
jgi:hypothetical protein